MRYLIIFALLYLCYYVVKKAFLPLFRSYKSFKARQYSSKEKELVQDPWCHIYIPKETALRATVDGEVRYFCSPRCLEEYTRRHDAEQRR